MERQNDDSSAFFQAIQQIPIIQEKISEISREIVGKSEKGSEESEIESVLHDIIVQIESTNNSLNDDDRNIVRNVLKMMIIAQIPRSRLAHNIRKLKINP